jgi:protein-disulfide isomerase
MNTESILSERLSVPVGKRDHIEGPGRAPLTLVEYGDFECPYCGAAYWVIKTVQQAMGERLRFAFRHFPLTNSHPHAEHAAESSEAAGAQDRFWEMHDVLFEHQDALEDENLAARAEALGLDGDRVIREIKAGTYLERIREDFQSGVRSGVNGTPTFFINGRRYDGPTDPKMFIAVFNELLASPHEPNR